MINTENAEEAKKLIKKAIENGEKPIIVVAKDNEFNRKILEYGKFDILASAEAGNKKDGLKQLDSGFNHVLGAIATKNKVALGIDIAEISKLGKKDKALRLGRIMQNVRLCRKTKTKIKVLNFKDEKDVLSLLISLGASSQQAKEALDF